MPLTLRTSFDLEIPSRSPGEVRELCERRGFRLSGLRMRISGDRVRARYVAPAAEAASAPLLKAELVPTSTGTRVVGRVHLAAPIIHAVMHVGSGLALGLALVAAGVTTQNWQPVAIGSPLVLLCGWFCIEAVRNLDELPSYHRAAFERALLEALARK